MAFTIFTDSTTADANQVMANFTHIAKGDRLPRGGTSLDATTSTYNLGSSTYYWSTVFCDTLDYSGTLTTNKMWMLLADVMLTAGSTRVEISGLNGDMEGAYKIVYVGYDNMKFILNNVSSASYAYSFKQYGNTLWDFIPTQETSSTYFSLTPSPLSPIKAEIFISPDSGYTKTVRWEVQNGNSVNVLSDDYYFVAGVCNANITGTLTSITFYLNFADTANCTLKVYRAKNV